MLLSANIADIQARAYARSNLIDFANWLRHGTDDESEVLSSLLRVMREEYDPDTDYCVGNDDHDADDDQHEGGSDSDEFDETHADEHDSDSQDDTENE